MRSPHASLQSDGFIHVPHAAWLDRIRVQSTAKTVMSHVRNCDGQEEGRGGPKI